MFLLSVQKSTSETERSISDFNIVGLLKGELYNENDNTKAPNSSV